MKIPHKTRLLALSLLMLVGVLASACAPGEERQETAAEAAVKQMPTPDGRILTADQASDTISLIDVATNNVYGSVRTGSQPHHVVATPDGKEFWVSLYGENRVQVFDSGNLTEVASVDVKASNDDLAFDPQGKMLYISLGKDDAVAVVDVQARKLVQTVKVGHTPHGVRVTPDGQFLIVTNTADNTVSLLKLQPQASVAGTIKTGANPFEVYISPDSKTAYVSNFLGDSISIVDIASQKTVGTMRSGKQPAMIYLQDTSSGPKLWIANTGSAEVWVLDPVSKKLVTRIPAGKGAHGVVVTPTNKVFVTNTTDNTVTIIDAVAQKAIATVAVGNSPNGLTFLPNVR
jgi:YVTN family beta-propeller protein